MMEMILNRKDLLREEALVRAREVCQFKGGEVAPDAVVAAAEKFYAFLSSDK